MCGGVAGLMSSFNCAGDGGLADGLTVPDFRFP